MGKRYLYWRTPEGRPYRQQDGKHAPTATLASLGTLASVTQEGHSYSLPCFPQRYHLVLRSAAVIFDPDGSELNETDTWSIVNDAINSAILENGGGKPISPERLVYFADNSSAEFFRQPLQDFICVTTLSTTDLPTEPIEIGNCKIWKLSSRREDFRFPAISNDPTGDQRYRTHSESTPYLRIAVEAKGRTINEAVDKALDAINLLRGLWMLRDKLGRWSIPFGLHAQTPVGEILLGPIHTVHHPDGSLAIDNYWYESDYAGDRRLFKPEKGWDELEQFRSWALEQMDRHSYRHEIQQLLRQFAVALSQADPITAFLQLWCVLEKITDTVGQKYDETIKRASWPYSDRQFAKEQLEHLRFRRNQYVHSAQSGGEMDQTVLMAKSFVEHHLLWIIRNDFGVESLSEHGTCLSLPTNIETLAKRQNHLSRAIEMRTKKDKGE